MVEVPERNLAFELARVTETAAMAAARWQGRGDKETADQAAVDGCDSSSARSTSTERSSSERAKRTTPRCSSTAENVGTGKGEAWDVAVDPVDGTTLTAGGIPGAIAVIALAERGSNVRARELRLHGQDRGGPRVRGAALSCVGRDSQCRLWARDDAEREYAADNDHDLDSVLSIRDLVHSDRVLFAATGVTAGVFLDGVEFVRDGAVALSVMMRRKTGSTRHMTSRHGFTGLRSLSALILD